MVSLIFEEFDQSFVFLIQRWNSRIKSIGGWWKICCWSLLISSLNVKLIAVINKWHEHRTASWITNAHTMNSELFHERQKKQRKKEAKKAGLRNYWRNIYGDQSHFFANEKKNVNSSPDDYWMSILVLGWSGKRTIFTLCFLFLVKVFLQCNCWSWNRTKRTVGFTNKIVAYRATQTPFHTHSGANGRSSWSNEVVFYYGNCCFISSFFW